MTSELVEEQYLFSQLLFGPAMTAFPRWEYVRNYVTKYLVQYGEGFAYSFSILIKLISDDVLCTSRGTEAQFYLHVKS